MKLTLSAIKKFIDLELSAKEIAEKLTMLGIEVEHIENETPSFDGIISAQVLETEKHPSADKLTIAKITDGQNLHTVVCGAPNCRKGIKVAYAQIGATLTDEKGHWKIKKVKLRGVESSGMLCSSKELHLAEEASSIIELPEDVELGKDLSYLAEPIFEISLTPNLGYCQSALGIARELAALLKKEILFPKISVKEEGKDTAEKIRLEMNTPLCPRYACRIIENLQVRPSPFWLKKELEAMGQRSINAIVDAINYAMLLYNQPMHAFDYDKIQGHIIKVQTADKPLSFLGLDLQMREVPENALMIFDSKSPIAIAGVMGGQESAVSDTTQNILIESAFFDPVAVRKTSKNLGIRTESSIRFEKGCDPDMIFSAIDYAADLILSICGGIVQKKIFEKSLQSFEAKKISCRLKRVNLLLGTTLSLGEIEEIFKRLQFITKSQEKESLLVSVPFYRHDLKQEVDLVEEVARFYGYNNIPIKTERAIYSSLQHAPLYLLEKKIRTYLCQEGMQEVITCDLIGPDLVQKAPVMSSKEQIEVIHAKSKEQSILRCSFLPSFLEMVSFNFSHKNFDLSCFEIGRVHFKNEEHFTEQPTAALLITGNNRPHHWQKKPCACDFYDLKGIVENLFSNLFSRKATYEKSAYDLFHPYRQASIILDKATIGVMGEVHPKMLTNLDIKQKVYFAEINTSALLEYLHTKKSYVSICRYPSTERDLTLTMKKTTPASEIVKQVHRIHSPLLEDVYVLDLFEDEKIGKDKQNLTLRFIYRDKNKTISFEEAEKEHQKIVESLKSI